ncbi:Wd Repeat-Containing Protein 75 [Manis pentadactyla]|nr:Wd Repeat-Containing Protein 75 [Manis pentadactyla]
MGTLKLSKVSPAKIIHLPSHPWPVHIQGPQQSLAYLLSLIGVSAATKFTPVRAYLYLPRTETEMQNYLACGVKRPTSRLHPTS